MTLRTLAPFAAGLMGLIGTTAWAACEPSYPGCVYSPTSPAIAFAPAYAQAPVEDYRRDHRTSYGHPCGRCAPVRPAPVAAAAEEAPPMSDAFFYGGLSGGAGPGIDVAGYGGGGGGGGFSENLSGFSAAQAAAASLSAAYAQSNASASASATASATAIVIASGSAQGGGGSWNQGPWNGGQGAMPGGWNNGGSKPGSWGGGGKTGGWGSGGVGGWGHGGAGGGGSRHGCGCSAHRK